MDARQLHALDCYHQSPGTLRDAQVVGYMLAESWVILSHVCIAQNNVLQADSARSERTLFDSARSIKVGVPPTVRIPQRLNARRNRMVLLSGYEQSSFTTGAIAFESTGSQP